jgi:hypothetical protein
MRLSRRFGLITAALLLLSGATAGLAQQAAGRVRGQVLDGSDAVVPRAAAEAIVAGRVGTTITDERANSSCPRFRRFRDAEDVIDGFATSTLVRDQPGLETGDKVEGRLAV